MRYSLFFAGLAVVLAELLGGCASGPTYDTSTAEGGFKTAQQLEKDERYEEALSMYNDVKNKHPYSKYALEAELHIADIHYKKEEFIESQTAYQLFKDFHPRYARSDYVTFRLAMSYFMQLPPTADRDLSPSTKAIQYFDEVINNYSTSDYVKEAKEKKQLVLHMLAEKESYIGNFYFIRDMYDSALRRYEGLLAKYSGYGFDDIAMYRAGVSAYETGDNTLGDKYLEELIAKFPSSSYASDARSAMREYGRR